MRAMRALALLVVFACSSNKPAPESPEPAASMIDCAKVADHVAATVAADKPRTGATNAAVKEMVATRCEKDAWSDEAKRCLNAIATIAEGRACGEQLTEAQREAIRADARALRKDATEPVAEDDRTSDWIKHVVEEPAKP
jgi:hypothetical protein